jgi:hypothetical protein
MGFFMPVVLVISLVENALIVLPNAYNFVVS